MTSRTDIFEVMEEATQPWIGRHNGGREHGPLDLLFEAELTTLAEKQRESNRENMRLHRRCKTLKCLQWRENERLKKDRSKYFLDSSTILVNPVISQMYSVVIESDSASDLLQLVCEAHKLGIKATVVEGAEVMSTPKPVSVPTPRPIYAPRVEPVVLRSSVQSRVPRQRIFEFILRELCNGLEQPFQDRGRPRLPIADIVFSSVVKVGSNKGGREACYDLANAGLRPLNHNSISLYLRSEAVTSILDQCISLVTAPLISMEPKLDYNSSGFSTTTYETKIGGYGEKRNQRWILCGALVGTETKLISSVETLPIYVSDPTEIPDLLSRVNFTRREITYPTLEIPAPLERLCCSIHESRTNLHLQSNPESAFTLIKEALGGSVRSKDRTSQVNEVLCKILAHDLGILTNWVEDLGIDLDALAN